MDHTQANKTVLGPDCRISGELALDQDAVILGRFEGNLRVRGCLELAESAEVSGTIEAGSLRLAGHAEADVVVDRSVELMPGSYLVGQVCAGRFHVTEGAVFQGDVRIGPNAVDHDTDPAEHDDDAPIAGSIGAESGPVNAILRRRRKRR